MARENFEMAAVKFDNQDKAPNESKPRILAYLAIVGAFIAGAVLGNIRVGLITANGASAIDEALSNYSLNELNSKTVYNQIVTNGWAAKDLLKAIGDQNATIIDNQNATAHLIQGTNTLLTFGLGMVAVIGITLLVAVYSKKR